MAEKGKWVTEIKIMPEEQIFYRTHVKACFVKMVKLPDAKSHLVLDTVSSLHEQKGKNLLNDETKQNDLKVQKKRCFVTIEKLTDADLMKYTKSHKVDEMEKTDSNHSNVQKIRLCKKDSEWFVDDSRKIFVPDLELSSMDMEVKEPLDTISTHRKFLVMAEKVSSNVQKIIDDSRKIFLTDLELNQSIEMDKENKKNMVIPAKKKAWKPIMGAKTLRRKKLSSRSNSIFTDDQEIDLLSTKRFD